MKPLPILISVLFMISTILSADVKKDETVLLFPAIASLNQQKSHYSIEIHGHIFEKEEKSLLRRSFTATLAKSLNLPQGEFQSKRFRSRVHWFLIDNERWKKLNIRIGNKVYQTNRSRANGHFRKTVHVATNSIQPAKQISMQVEMPVGDSRKFIGQAFILEPNGVSVVSDIDDTIKISDVRNKKELMRNTFLREFQAVAGMSTLYRKLAKKGADFHYISASPWQLYTLLSTFVREQKFPDGTYIMKNFRAKDSDFFNLFSSPKQYKIQKIEPLFKKFPKRKFILIGDSGEKDPDAYAYLAEKYPKQVLQILIRRAYPEDSMKKFEKIFQKIPKSAWQVFDKPAEIKSLLTLFPEK